MTPLEFITDADSDYNSPAGDVMAAIRKPLIIRSENSEWEVLSYYFDEKQKKMVLDIEEKA